MLTSASPRRQVFSGSKNGGYSSTRLLLVGLIHVVVVCSAPITKSLKTFESDVPEPKSPEDATLWIYLGIALVLVLLGGAFAGLTIAYVRHSTATESSCKPVKLTAATG